jgi:hypothetical protein
VKARSAASGVAAGGVGGRGVAGRTVRHLRLRLVVLRHRRRQLVGVGLALQVLEPLVDVVFGDRVVLGHRADLLAHRKPPQCLAAGRVEHGEELQAVCQGPRSVILAAEEEADEAAHEAGHH